MFDSPPIVLIQFLNTESVTRKRGPPWSPCYMRKSTLEIDRYYGIVPLDPFRMQGFSYFLGLFQVTVAKPQEIFWSLPRSKEALTWLADIYVYKDICVEFFLQEQLTLDIKQTSITMLNKMLFWFLHFRTSELMFCWFLLSSIWFLGQFSDINFEVIIPTS